LLRAAGKDGWDLQGHAEWSPDGKQLVMFGGRRSNPQIHITTAVGARVRQVTKRGGVSLDPSWSGDGRTIAFVGCPQAVCFPSGYEIYTVDAARVDATDATRVTTDTLQDQDPYFARDGSAIAWLTKTSATGTPVGAWNIRVANPDGSAARRLTNDDGKVNSKPEWSLDGTLIYFHRMDYPKSTRFSVWSIRPDGSGLREITVGQPGVNEFPSA
jgi:TolB protein